MARYNIPVSFQKVREHIGTLGQSAATIYQNKTARLAMYEGMMSSGYKTNYTYIPVRIVAIEGNGLPSRSWRYSGRRYNEAEKVFTDSLQLFE